MAESTEPCPACEKRRSRSRREMCRCIATSSGPMPSVAWRPMYARAFSTRCPYGFGPRVEPRSATLGLPLTVTLRGGLSGCEISSSSNFAAMYPKVSGATAMLDREGDVLSQMDSSLSTPRIESSSGTLRPVVLAKAKAVSAIRSDAAKRPMGRGRDRSA